MDARNIAFIKKIIDVMYHSYEQNVHIRNMIVENLRDEGIQPVVWNGATKAIYEREIQDYARAKPQPYPFTPLVAVPMGAGAASAAAAAPAAAPILPVTGPGHALYAMFRMANEMGIDFSYVGKVVSNVWEPFSTAGGGGGSAAPSRRGSNASTTGGGTGISNLALRVASHPLHGGIGASDGADESTTIIAPGAAAARVDAARQAVAAAQREAGIEGARAIFSAGHAPGGPAALMAEATAAEASARVATAERKLADALLAAAATPSAELTESRAAAVEAEATAIATARDARARAQAAMVAALTGGGSGSSAAGAAPPGVAALLTGGGGGGSASTGAARGGAGAGAAPADTTLSPEKIAEFERTSTKVSDYVGPALATVTPKLPELWRVIKNIMSDDRGVIQQYPTATRKHYARRLQEALRGLRIPGTTIVNPDKFEGRLRSEEDKQAVQKFINTTIDLLQHIILSSVRGGARRTRRRGRRSTKTRRQH
jgi:hypothetical protein